MKISSLALLSFTVTGGLSAQLLVNVDFNNGGSPTYSGAGAIGTAGDVWNGVSVPGFGTITGTDLLDNTGLATAIDYSLNHEGAWGSSGNDLLSDYVYLNPGSNGTLTISGLAPSANYDLYLYNAGDTAGQGASFTIGGNTQVSSGNPLNTTSFVANQNYVSFTGMTASGSGEITVSWTTLPGQYSGFNGFQLAIPEPSTYAAIAGALALGLVTWRRRR